MNKDILEKTEKILQSIGIPSQPRVLLDIEDETKKEDPDFGVIAELVSRDVAMSAKIIKVCNSPYFGLRQKVDTIHKALNFLGLKNFKNVILASALRENMSSKKISQKDFEYFCNHSFFTAKVAETIAYRVLTENGTQIDPNQAYMAGLFHDCAIPLFTNKYNDYIKQLAKALISKGSMIAVEEELFQTNHCIAAHLVAKSWRLPDIVCKAIQNHHTNDLDAVDTPEAKKLLAALVLAESIIYYKDSNMTPIFDIFNYNIGEEYYDNLMLELEFSKDDIADIEDSVDRILETAAEL